MKTLRHTLAAALLLGLAACGQAADEAADPAAPAPAAEAPLPVTKVEEKPVVALAPEGLMLVASSGKTRLLDFGLGKAQVVEILTQAQGAAGKEIRNEECGAGPMVFVEWPDGLTALFQDDRFAGWSVGRGASPKLTTMNGVGVGSTRSELIAAFAGATIEESTLGQEFTAGGLSGILDGTAPTAKIDAIWAGTSCVFR
jgi:hypothetical protein